MDILDFITSRKVLCGKVANEGKKASDDASNPEKRRAKFRSIIHRENTSKHVNVERLKNAIQEIRKIKVSETTSNNLKHSSHSKHSETPKPNSHSHALDNCKNNKKNDRRISYSRKRKGIGGKRLIFRMPVGNEVGTDISRGLESFCTFQRTVNKDTQGLLDKKPVPTICGVPQPVDRFMKNL